MKTRLIVLALVLELIACAQVRQEIREHPVRTLVVVGGAIAVGSIAGSRNNDSQQRQAFWPYVCNSKPEACR